MLEEQLNELSIFSLRELARRTGVNSPTSKKKQQLIDDIIAINNGVKKPHIPKTKQGRPPKTFGYDVSNIFSSKNQQAPSFSKSASLNQDCKGFEYVNNANLEGVLEIVSNNVGFLWVNSLQDYSCYFVPTAVIEKYPLKSGDKVLAVVNFGEDQTVVEDILSVNSIPVAEINNRKNYFEIEHVLNKEQLEVEQTTLLIYKGENTYLYGNDNNKNTACVVNLINGCIADSKIYINVSIVEKNKHVLKDIKDAELFVSKLTDSVETARRIVSLAVERAKRLIENDKHVVVVVDDALSVAGIDTQELEILKQLMSITKNGENGSITIVAIMDKFKQISQIEKLADSKIEI